MTTVLCTPHVLRAYWRFCLLSWLPVTVICSMVLLAGCAPRHRVPLDDDGLPVTTAADDNPPRSDPDHGPGGGHGLWPEMLHTAMRAGMGMIHH